MKKLAFTLAEVLLVIAIIGTVSVLTVNNAIKSTNTAEKITQLKKWEFPLWHNRIGSILRALGHRFKPWPSTVG